MSSAVSQESQLLPERKKPGPRPGGYNPGAFKPGDPRISGGGRNSALYMMKQAACNDLVPKALAAYKTVLKDPDHKDYAAVARDVLNRVYGSPVTEGQKAQQEAAADAVDVKQLSTAELERLVAGGLSQLLEGECEELDEGAESNECD